MFSFSSFYSQGAWKVINMGDFDATHAAEEQAYVMIKDEKKSAAQAGVIYFV